MSTRQASPVSFAGLTTWTFVMRVFHSLIQLTPKDPNAYRVTCQCRGPARLACAPRCERVICPLAMRHVIAIDQGTTGTTVLVLDEQLAVRGRGYQEFRQIYPQPGWVEHDPEDIWRSVTSALAQATAGITPSSIAAVGITNQRETTVLWDRTTGKAAHHAIVWQDRRTADRCRE